MITQRGFMPGMIGQYAGLPVATFNERMVLDCFLSTAEAAWYVATSPEYQGFDDPFARFLREVDTTEVTALIIGFWGVPGQQCSGNPAVALTESAASFPNLKSLFLGDILQDGVSDWIESPDISPLFAAFPGLERFDVHAAEGFALHPIGSEGLKVLRFESGGLPAEVVHGLGASALPNLEHLDLWLGEEHSGGDTTVADLAPFLGGEHFPALRHLGLENSEIQDEIAAAVASAPIVARLESLSLAMGTLTDQGAEALLAGQPLTHLRRLDLHHHFLSDTMVQRVKQALPGVEVNLSGKQRTEDEGGPYVAAYI